jgi:pyridoxamine 5'-phosphate oxidase family protein
VARSELSALERRWLADPPQALARIATVDADGMPHVVPGGWSFDSASEEIILGGRDVPRTQRAVHVRATGRAAVVIDGLAPGPGWSPWAFAIRGRARVDDDLGVIRVALDYVTSWGLESVTVATPAGERPEP